MLEESTNTLTGPPLFGGILKIIGVNNQKRQTFPVTGNSHGDLGLEYGVTTAALSLIFTVISVILMTFGAGIMPGVYKDAGYRVRTG